MFRLEANIRALPVAHSQPPSVNLCHRWPVYPAHTWVPQPYPVYGASGSSGSARLIHYICQHSENAPSILKPVKNFAQADLPPTNKQKRDDLEGHLNDYFTLPTVPLVFQFCREGNLGENYWRRIAQFLKEQAPLQKLLDRSKIFTTNLQSEITVFKCSSYIVLVHLINFFCLS